MSQRRLLLGPGKRTAILARLLDEQAAVGPASLPARRRTAPGFADARLDDLAELLRPRSESGLLILDALHLSRTEIGLVAAFLKREGGWRVLVLGRPHELSSDALATPTGESRVRWLAFPPGLDDVRRLLRDELPPLSELFPGYLAPTPAPDEQPARRRVAIGHRDGPDADGSRPAAVVFDLHELLEEVLAGRALDRPEARLRFRSRGWLVSEGDSRVLRAALVELLDLVEACAGDEDGIELLATELKGRTPNTAVVIVFPSAPLMAAVRAGAAPRELLRADRLEGVVGPDAARASRASGPRLASFGARLGLRAAGPRHFELILELPRRLLGAGALP